MASLVQTLVEQFPVKFYWFLKQGYQPHIWQILFHAAHNDEVLARFRHLVAGRRGGKTLSAAWEVLFYALHPREFHRDAHGVEKDRSLWIWALSEDYPTGRASLITFLEVIGEAGLVKDRDYRYNRTEKTIEFLDSGTLVEFKTADDPQRLRGAGLDILWMDEAAFISSQEAWEVVFPALGDKLGLVITTTTPHGKNWFYDFFFNGVSLEDPHHFRVEYTSVDNPYFPRSEWEYARATQHPINFKREYLASFDAMSGIELSGDWLKYWVEGSPKRGEILLPKAVEGKLPFRTYMGIDPAISLADTADYFAMSLIGVTEDNSQAYLLETFKGRLTFPEQLDHIRMWHLEHRPTYIGIESNAFQHILVQQAMRLEGLPPVVAVLNRAKKSERILGMSPLFKIGRIRINRRHVDFIEEWINYTSAVKNPKDDLLDATEIAIGVAGVLLPAQPMLANVTDRPRSLQEEALEQLREMRDGGVYDPELGSEA